MVTQTVVSEPGFFMVFDKIQYKMRFYINFRHQDQSKQLDLVSAVILGLEISRNVGKNDPNTTQIFLVLVWKDLSRIWIVFSNISGKFQTQNDGTD